jgi:predicted Zn-dependent protease
MVYHPLERVLERDDPIRQALRTFQRHRKRSMPASRKALEKRPNDPVILKKLGDLYLKAEKVKSALRDLREPREVYNTKGFYHQAVRCTSRRSR